MAWNIRVYAIIVHESKNVLLMDECRNGLKFTKFPGGGVEFGEGVKDALCRELIEELNAECKVGELFYFNDFYQKSAFRKEDQLISFYYLVELNDMLELNKFKILDSENYEIPRWHKIDELHKEMFLFPLDAIAAEKLILTTYPSPL